MYGQRAFRFVKGCSAGTIQPWVRNVGRLWRNSAGDDVQSDANHLDCGNGRMLLERDRNHVSVSCMTSNSYYDVIFIDGGNVRIGSVNICPPSVVCVAL